MPSTAETHIDAVRRLRAHRAEIRALGVRRIGVFGSVARGGAGPESDIDVLVEFEPEVKSFDAFLQLAAYLEEITDRPVELVTQEGLSPYNKSRILEELIDVDLAD